MLDDLRALYPRLDADLRSGALEARSNQEVHTRITFRNVDLVLRDPRQPGPLHTVRAAIEHKTLMTAHGKVRKNRYGDIVAYANHIHNHSTQAIAAASVVINMLPEYVNPDLFARDVVRPQLKPQRWQSLIAGTVKLFTDIPLRERQDEPNDQPEALTVILVEYDGRTSARLVSESPAPQPGEAAHVLDFYERIARLYTQRYPQA